MILALLLTAVNIVTIDPGHFHAALVQKQAFAEVANEVKVFAPVGAELDAHLKLIESFNARKDSPTAWKEHVVSGPDFLERFKAEAKSGKLGEQPVVVLAGKNNRKGEYALAAVEAGCGVFSDKPMAITPEVFAQTEQAARIAQQKGLMFADIMTERRDFYTMLVRELTFDKALYGEQDRGTTANPAVVSESVHHFFKNVNGAVLKRPEWYYDTTVQGEGIVDVTTHLVDVVQWIVCPNLKLTKGDIEMLSARTWPTRITPAQFKASTGGEKASAFNCYSNGEFNWRLRGVNCKVSVVWNFEAPKGTGDTGCLKLRGTNAEFSIRQGAAEGYRRGIYVKALKSEDATGKALGAALARLSVKWPGITAVATKEAGVWQLMVPEKLTCTHEEQFSQLFKVYLGWLKTGREDPDYIDNMLVKYHTIVEAYKLAKKGK